MFKKTTLQVTSELYVGVIFSWWWLGGLVKSDLINTTCMYEDNDNCQKDNSLQ